MHAQVLSWITLVALGCATLIQGSVCAAEISVDEQGGTTVLSVDGKAKYKVIQGDILIPLDLEGIEAVFDTDLWGGGEYPHIVNYGWDEDLPQNRRNTMLGVFAIIEAFVHVQFVEGWGVLEDHIVIHSTNPADCLGCDCVNNASVGSTLFGDVNICDWDTDVILHELGHVLGFWHEHSRPDRDQYVEINWENIEAEKEHNFDLHSAPTYGSYDFASLMHYTQCAFSIGSCNPWNDPTDRPTITLLPPNEVWQTLIGLGTTYSALDSLTLRLLYWESDWRFADHTAASGDGFFLEPFGTFVEAYNDVPAGGTVWFKEPGTYAPPADGVLSKEMTLRAPLGGVVLQ